MSELPARWVLMFVASLLGLILLFVYDNSRSLHALEHIQSDRWTGTDMELWVEELRERNPDLDIPEAVHVP